VNNKKESATNLTSASLLAKNTLWNTLGLILPLLVGVVAMPYLIHGLGNARFGVLSIAWMVIGYFSIFDFGLGRALTKLIAELLGQGKEDSIPALFWTGMSIMMSVGVIGSIIVGLLSENIVFSWLNIDKTLQQETLSAFYILAFSIPFVIATTGFRGVLEAHQQFAISNIIRIPLGLLTFLGPLAVLPFSKSLDSIVMILLIGRITGTYIYYHFCVKVVPSIRDNISVDKSVVGLLLSYGGWMTVSNVIGPMMVYLDRFLIGSVLTMTAVSYYVAPYEVVTKLWMIPVGLIGVLFPAFSTMLSSDRDKAALYFQRAINIIFYFMFPVFLFVNMFSYEGIELWLGSEFAEHSTVVMQWLSIGVFLNCVGRVPFILVQSAGRPDLAAKLFLIELPLYLICLWYALNHFGIEGAAIVWALRVLIDTVAFFFLSGKIFPEVLAVSRILTGKLLVASLALLLVTFIHGMILKLALLLILFPIFLFIAWNYGLSLGDRRKLILLVSKS